MSKIIIHAGSGYGTREAVYELKNGILVLEDEGEHDNLAGNSKAASFNGYTLQDAEREMKELNSEERCTRYDGCHWCQWHIGSYEVEDEKESNIILEGLN